MTRAERIEALLVSLRSVCLEGGFWQKDIDEALALPPDPVPRRLTAEDFAALLGRRVLPGDHGNAGFLNARIFGS